MENVFDVLRGNIHNHRSPTPLCALTLAIALGTAHCTEPSQQSKSRGNPSDSVDLPVVQLSFVDAPEYPAIALRLIFSTAPYIELGHVAGAVILPDSSLLVADRMSSELISFDRDGNILAKAGRLGDGPGEYRYLTHLGVGMNGTPFVFDRRHRRITFVDPRGRATGILRVSGIGEMMPLTLLEGRDVLTVFEPTPLLPPGVQRGSLFLLSLRNTADDAHELSADTLGSWPGKERHVSADGNDWNPFGFGATALYAGRGAYALVGTNDPIDLVLYERGTAVVRMRGDHHMRQSVTALEQKAWAELFLSMYAEERRPARREELERSGVREEYPAIGTLQVDEEGRVWIGSFAKLTEQHRVWRVFASSGSVVGTLTLPVFWPEWDQYGRGRPQGREPVEWEVTIPNASHELLDVGAGRLAVLRRGGMGEEFIEVYELDVPK